MRYFGLSKLNISLIFIFFFLISNPVLSFAVIPPTEKTQLIITFDPADTCNYNKRIRSIVLHYTVLDEDASRIVLKQGGVSSHYLIPKKAKPNGTDLWQFVALEERAWHAGESYWQTRNNLDDTSIGIEIVNYGYGLVQNSGKIVWPYQVENKIKQMLIDAIKKDPVFYHLLLQKKLLNAFIEDLMRNLVPPRNRLAYEKYIQKKYIQKYKTLADTLREKYDLFLNIKLNDLYDLEQQGKLVWDDFTPHQRISLANLLKKLIKELAIKDKNGRVCAKIQATDIIGHSDIAPDRKSDPGPRFPWKYLAQQGIGAWPNDQDVNAILKKISKDKKINIARLQNNLRLYGYKIQTTKVLDSQTKEIVRAFQWHFEPNNASGIPSLKTVALLEALIKKYFPEEDQQIINPYQIDFSTALKKDFNTNWQTIKNKFLNRELSSAKNKISLFF
jgi:N-acetyl-anhydromuramyl-L-alanine amidase AmpD